MTSQRNTERYMPNGQFEDVVEVQIQATDGTYKTLIVPAARYTRDNVIALGNAWIEQHNAVATIGNP
ncbi:MAG TPA: hypothetical protein VFU23_10995 [Gemmatimonadales bacterium]|nr:hypothetical protein [Gemmatimonadales bacterium]